MFRIFGLKMKSTIFKFILLVFCLSTISCTLFIPKSPVVVGLNTLNRDCRHLILDFEAISFHDDKYYIEKLKPENVQKAVHNFDRLQRSNPILLSSVFRDNVEGAKNLIELMKQRQISQSTSEITELEFGVANILCSELGSALKVDDSIVEISYQ